jgi:hypothetical protein
MMRILARLRRPLRAKLAVPRRPHRGDGPEGAERKGSDAREAVSGP